jgi:hypothetical protein
MVEYLKDKLIITGVGIKVNSVTVTGEQSGVYHFVYDITVVQLTTNMDEDLNALLALLPKDPNADPNAGPPDLPSMIPTPTYLWSEVPCTK